MGQAIALNLIRPPRPDNRGAALAAATLARPVVALFGAHDLVLNKPAIGLPQTTANEHRLLFGRDNVPLVELALPAATLSQLVAAIFGGAPALPVCGELPKLLLARLGAQLLPALAALAGPVQLLPADLLDQTPADWFALGFPQANGALTVELRLDPRLLPSRVASDADSDRAWHADLEAAVLAATLPVRAVLAEKELTLDRLARLKSGDFIPLVPPAFVQLLAGDRPLARATIGESNARVAVRIDQLSRKALH